MNIELVKILIYWVGIVVFLLLEINMPYRSPTVSKLKRWMVNIPLSLLNGVIYGGLYLQVMEIVFRQVDGQQLGLLNSYNLPAWLKVMLGIFVLDFTIYIWHLLNHEIPFLWRFHRVHHSDLNMDVSTANRFHLGELLLSGLVRLIVIYSFGITLITYILFEIVVNLSIQFHHSSLRILPAFEKKWMTFFVPPSMHRIHHSVKISERDSNYGVIFSFWDRMMGTMRQQVNQNSIIIGIGSHRDVARLDFLHVLAMPFTRNSR